MAGIHAASFINSNRDVKKHPDPVELPVPWPSRAQAEKVSPEDRAALREKLLRHSAFAATDE